MGYLLKEALNALCGINQWAYAVFWKIGQRNPKLLIWEEYYYGPEPFSGPGETLGNEKPEVHCSQAGDPVSLLVNKMMMDHHVNVVGEEGLIGRVAFTGRHQWIVAENFYGEAHPPQVLEDIFEQFSAGIQTIAAIPVLPHGVVQFGSYFKIKENTGFLDDVASLLHQLGVLMSHDDSAIPRLPLPESRGCLDLGDMSLEADTMMETSSASFSYIKNSIENSLFEVQTSLDTKPYCPGEATAINPAIKPGISSPIQFINGVAKANIDEVFKGFMEENYMEQMFESQLGSVNYTMFDYSVDDIFEAFGNNITSHESSSTIFSSMCSDNLLDAVVSGVLAPKEDTVLCKTTLTDNMTISSSTGKASLSHGRLDVHVNRGFLGIPEYLATKAETGSISQCSSVCDPSTHKGKDVRNCAGYSKKPPESNGAKTRKRLRPGENPRPRPRDRQMIQDRVKELREIVPNGAKCSIDALLERTIKHMLFLQSITDHAHKLKQTVESQISNSGSLSKDKFERGATWAYEIGSNSTICPIVVEDLNQPGRMLVEMVCEESGSFLEIADVIRGLGLTILKGTMEAMNDGKIWTRFVVEAANNREVTRMEVLISLVRLLEQNPKNCEQSAANVMTTPPCQRASSSASTVQ